MPKITIDQRIDFVRHAHARTESEVEIKSAAIDTLVRLKNLREMLEHKSSNLDAVTDELTKLLDL